MRLTEAAIGAGLAIALVSHHQGMFEVAYSR